MKTIIEGCFKRPGAVILALILIFFSGISAFLSIPKEASPDVEIPVAYVSVAYDGISPSDAEKLLTKPLEKELKTVTGLKKMTSAATEGYTSITVEFDAGEDIDLVLVEGWKFSKIKKIEVYRKKINKPLLCNENKNFVAIATTSRSLKIKKKIPILNLNDTEEVGNFILNYFKN